MGVVEEVQTGKKRWRRGGGRVGGRAKEGRARGEEEQPRER